MVPDLSSSLKTTIHPATSHRHHHHHHTLAAYACLYTEEQYNIISIYIRTPTSFESANLLNSKDFSNITIRNSTVSFTYRLHRIS